MSIESGRISADLNNEGRLRFRADLISSTGLYSRSSTAVEAVYIAGTVEQVSDLSRLSNSELLKIRGIGKKTVAQIRQQFPYVPEVTGDKESKHVSKNVRYSLLAEQYRSGPRSMITEERCLEDGSIVEVRVPKTLSPREISVLSTMDYLKSQGTEEVVGYLLIRKLLPEEKTTRPDYRYFYEIFDRLSNWGYLNSRRELLPMGRGRRIVNKVILSLTEYGKEKLSSSVPLSTAS